jgi:magnesium chelatase family protein
MTIVGLPDTALQESRERVQTAVKNAGLHFQYHCIVVNLVPATARKETPLYDLPIVLGVIVLAGFLLHNKVENTIVVGELSLDRAVQRARGVLSKAATALANGFRRI